MIFTFPKKKKKKKYKQNYFIHSSLHVIYNIDTGNNNIQHEENRTNRAQIEVRGEANIEIRDQLQGTPMAWANNSIPGPSQPPTTSNSLPFTQPFPTQHNTHRPIPVTPKNRLSEEQKLVVVRYCIAAVEDYKLMGKQEFFDIQREIIKRREGFDCSVEAVMGDILIRAKVC